MMDIFFDTVIDDEKISLFGGKERGLSFDTPSVYSAFKHFLGMLVDIDNMIRIKVRVIRSVGLLFLRLRRPGFIIVRLQSYIFFIMFFRMVFNVFKVNEEFSDYKIFIMFQGTIINLFCFLLALISHEKFIECFLHI